MINTKVVSIQSEHSVLASSFWVPERESIGL